MKKQQRKYKSKRSVCIVTMVVVAIVIIVIGVCGREKKVETSKRKVMLGNWKQQGNEYHICTVEANGHEINCACSDKKWERFETELSLQEMAKQNKDFIKEITWHLNFGKEVKGNLYFAGNNYYVIYEDIETEDVTNDYIARCNTCEISYGFDIEYGVAPFPMEMTFDSGWQEKWVEEGNEKDYYSRFFDIFTFEEMCEYYGRYTDGTAQIDCDNQLIYVDVYDESSKLDENETALAEKFLCIDFQNQRFILNKGGDYEKIYE